MQFSTDRRTQISRLLADAWDMTRATFAYTNHTLLPEALESWPLPLFERLLPRHMQLIYAINTDLLRTARRLGEMDDRASRLDIADRRERRAPRERMANLAFAGSHSINGVAALHTELMKENGVRRLCTSSIPSCINNKTNGIATPRRWPAAMQSRPDRSDPRRDRRWLPGRCRKTHRAGADGERRSSSWNDLAKVKHANKVALANFVKEQSGFAIMTLMRPVRCPGEADPRI